MHLVVIAQCSTMTPQSHTFAQVEVDLYLLMCPCTKQDEQMSSLIHPLTVPSPPSGITITRVLRNTVELNWLPPTEPNGEVHYVIYYTPEGGTEQSIDTGSNLTHYNLTGLERNRVYNISVQAVNVAGRSYRSALIARYKHTPPGELCNTNQSMNMSFSRRMLNPSILGNFEDHHHNSRKRDKVYISHVLYTFNMDAYEYSTIEQTASCHQW